MGQLRKYPKNGLKPASVLTKQIFLNIPIIYHGLEKEEFKNGIAVIRPEDKVLAVRIVFTGMSDAMITSFQNLRIEK